MKSIYLCQAKWCTISWRRHWRSGNLTNSCPLKLASIQSCWKCVIATLAYFLAQIMIKAAIWAPSTQLASVYNCVIAHNLTANASFVLSWHLISRCPIRNVLQEKNGIMWEKFPSGGPPPPQFGKPLLWKTKLGLFFILGPQEHFWSSPKNHHFGW